VVGHKAPGKDEAITKLIDGLDRTIIQQAGILADEIEKIMGSLAA